MKNKNLKKVIGFRPDSEVYKKLEAIASVEGKFLSQVVEEMVERGFSQINYENDFEIFQRKILTQNEVLQSHLDIIRKRIESLENKVKSSEKNTKVQVVLQQTLLTEYIKMNLGENKFGIFLKAAYDVFKKLKDEL